MPPKTRAQIDEKLVESLYLAYPRRISPATAKKAIRKALQTTSYDVLLEAVQAYAKARAGEDKSFTPYPASWFNGQRWLDDRSEWCGCKKQNGSREATEAYLHACKAMKLTDAYWAMNFKDKVIEAAIHEVGGWRKFCDWPTNETQFRQRLFEAAYSRLKQ